MKKLSRKARANQLRRAGPNKVRQKKLNQPFSRFKADQQGTIIMMLAITLPLLVAMVGLAVDVGNWYYAERRAQTGVDSGAIAAAMTLYNGGYLTEVEDAAFDSAKRNDFGPGTGRVVEVQSPPSSGAYAGDTRPLK